jgi:hypothetical protein
MTAKLDGTNGLLQQYDYQTPTTGFSYTFAAGINVLVMQPAGTLATGTITMPASPADGMTITFSSTQIITALTLNGNTGQTVVSGTTKLAANQAATYVYRLSNTSWYPTATVPSNVPVTPAGGSIITSGTAVGYASFTTTTYNDFTGIPSWVKRITVMFNGVSTSGTSLLQIQIGSGSVETSTYIGTSTSAAGTVQSVALTTGFIVGTPSAAATYSGNAVLTNLSGNIWSLSSVMGRNDGRADFTGGVKSISGTLDRVRITTVNGTDTFDAGSINILYE